jgi:apolipoprotein N-acyltransferase
MTAPARAAWAAAPADFVLRREQGAAGGFTAVFVRLRARLDALPPFVRYVAAICFGVSGAAALPPLYVLPLLIPAFAGFLWLVEGAPTRREAAALGYGFGLGHFTAGLYWVANALLTDPERYGLVAPLAPLSLAALFAVYTAVAAFVSKLAFRSRYGGSFLFRLTVFAAAFALTEWLRGHALTGFAWNLIGTVWGLSGGVMQSTALIGTYGLGFLTVVAAAAPAALGEPLGSARRKIVTAALPYALFAAIWAGGLWRLQGAGPAASEPGVPKVVLRIVQPDIAQSNKWVPELRIAHLKRDLDLTRAAAKPSDADSTVVVIWPETAVPFLVDQDEAVRDAIATVVPKGGLVITGAPRATPPGVEPYEVFNGIVAVDEHGSLAGMYDKHHLVPFGEYLPFRGYVPAWMHLDKLTPGAIDFTAGSGPATLHLPGVPPISPLICYEIIFPGEVTDDNDRPQLLVNVTNDAWFGESTGPYQHFVSARFRSVEEGIPVARAANTGISGVVDSYGRVVARLGLGRQGAIDAPVPRALAGPPLYAKVGDWMLVFVIILWALLAATVRRLAPE